MHHLHLLVLPAQGPGRRVEVMQESVSSRAFLGRLGDVEAGRRGRAERVQAQHEVNVSQQVTEWEKQNYKDVTGKAPAQRSLTD